jgi:hypothetical protein
MVVMGMERYRLSQSVVSFYDACNVMLCLIPPFSSCMRALDGTAIGCTS